MLFNQDDFMDSVVWSANLVYEYGDLYASLKYDQRTVIPINDIKFYKPDLVNAHYLLVIYYKRKENMLLLEQAKQSLYTLSKFQEVDENDVQLIEKWDENLYQAKMKVNTDDFSGSSEAPALKGTEEIYNKYYLKTSEELKKLIEELNKC